jgi:hypothetical protein
MEEETIISRWLVLASGDKMDRLGQSWSQAKLIWLFAFTAEIGLDWTPDSPLFSCLFMIDTIPYSTRNAICDFSIS